MCLARPRPGVDVVFLGQNARKRVRERHSCRSNFSYPRSLHWSSWLIRSALSPYLAITQGLPKRARRSVALRAALIAVAILAGSALIGDWLLHTLSIGLPAFRIAGGPAMMRDGPGLSAPSGNMVDLPDNGRVAGSGYGGLKLLRASRRDRGGCGRNGDRDDRRRGAGAAGATTSGAGTATATTNRK